MGNNGSNFMSPEQWTWSLAKNSNCIQPGRLYLCDTDVINTFLKSIQTAQILGVGKWCRVCVFICLHLFFFSLFPFDLALFCWVLGLECYQSSLSCEATRVHLFCVCVMSVCLPVGGVTESAGRTQRSYSRVEHVLLDTFGCWMVNE